MQTWTSDLVIQCPSGEGRTASLSWAERPVLEMVLVIGCSVMAALGQLPRHVQRIRAQSRLCSAGPPSLSQEAWLCKDTAVCPQPPHSRTVADHWCFPLPGTSHPSPSPALPICLPLPQHSPAQQPRLGLVPQQEMEVGDCLWLAC